MSWHPYRLEYELLSPLHIGHHKVGNVQRTRHYVPGRNLWGAVSERLTRLGFSRTIGCVPGDYRAVGDWLSKHVTFGYLFPWQGAKTLAPHYCTDGLCYGDLSAEAFERQYLAAQTSTVLDPTSTSALAGSLHEIELIVAYQRDGRRTRLAGCLWVSDVGGAELEAGCPNWLDNLQVGGERRLGFGRLRLIDRVSLGECCADDGFSLRRGYTRPAIVLDSEQPLRAHALVEGCRVKGDIEPLVGRETTHSGAFGQRLTEARLCWVPGSSVMNRTEFAVDGTGVWSALPDS